MAQALTSGIAVLLLVICQPLCTEFPTSFVCVFDEGRPGCGAILCCKQSIMAEYEQENI